LPRHHVYLKSESQFSKLGVPPDDQYNGLILLFLVIWGRAIQDAAFALALSGIPRKPGFLTITHSKVIEFK